jgi:hypothetical protein
VNWLTRQLSKAPDAVLIEAWTAWARSPGPCHPIGEVRAKPELLFDDPKKELRSFTVRLSAVAGTKRGQGRGTFVGSVLTLIDTFYEQVVQHLKPWTPPAPAPKGRQSESDDAADRDDISGQLPVKSVQRASTNPDWKPPEPPTEPSDESEHTTNVPASERTSEAEAEASTSAPAPIIKPYEASPVGIDQTVNGSV